MMKSHILQEVALFNILAEHGGSREVPRKKIPQSKVCTTVLRDCRKKSKFKDKYGCKIAVKSEKLYLKE
jgi:hypothetical protein